jgi:hypothetical protein
MFVTEIFYCFNLNDSLPFSAALAKNLDFLPYIFQGHKRDKTQDTGEIYLQTTTYSRPLRRQARGGDEKSSRNSHLNQSRVTAHCRRTAGGGGNAGTGMPQSAQAVRA